MQDQGSVGALAVARSIGAPAAAGLTGCAEAALAIATRASGSIEAARADATGVQRLLGLQRQPRQRRLGLLGLQSLGNGWVRANNVKGLLGL